MTSAVQPQPSRSGITFHHPVAFWLGTAAVTIGVMAHVPSFIDSRAMHYRMFGMPMTSVMLGGMLLILVGLALTTYGLVPLRDLVRTPSHTIEQVHFHAMDEAHLTRQHWTLLFVLGAALVIDAMKPATLGFVVPGMKSEYGITTKTAAMLPFAGLLGTTIGSLLWGMLADRIGRRGAILLASILFMGTAICGFMPSFEWNLVMCFLMGISAGGMLPIVYALMTEAMPAKRRGWLVVLHGGLGTLAGYLLASGLATWLEPQFTWRILWLPGLPTGFIMLVLNHWIPESPRFLLEKGRFEEAERVMQRFGVTLSRSPAAGATPASGVTSAAGATPATGATEPSRARAVPVDDRQSKLIAIFRKPYRVQTLTVGMYGLAWGLVNWGFLTFTPTILRDRGVPAASASKLLFWSALIAVPGTLLVAYLYGYWSSKKTMSLFALMTGAALVLFAVVDPGAGGNHASAVMPLMVLVLIGSGGVISMLSPYSAEVYPTRLRGTGSGFAAGSSKIGGILAPPVAALALSAAPGFGLIGLLAAGPIIAAAVIVLAAGVETRDRALEEVALPQS